MSREEAIHEMIQYFDEKAEVGIFWLRKILTKINKKTNILRQAFLFFPLSK